MFDGNQDYIWAEIWQPSRKKFGGAKHQSLGQIAEKFST